MKKIAIICTFFLVSCAPHFKNDGENILLKGPDGQEISLLVEVAADAEAQANGLMGREELPEEHGMLFVFSQPQTLSFWMKNTIIPLDVLFFDGDGNYISSHTMVPCMEDPCLHYRSAAPALTALEVPAGFVEEHAVEHGWSLHWRE
ncbi:MAG: DUF192 domain-containing protein [Candidatus Peribacteraceae bacterium]|jgi:hypothetical protein